ncbi:MAG TPA: polysaccharide deacetylase family protein [Mycobacteriales bacterium]|nr:polysaccharide deacetylase family protein [Mycobacteriales bacterium]
MFGAGGIVAAQEQAPEAARGRARSSRRTALQIGATAIVAAGAATAATVETDTYKRHHPTSTARVSPLVTDHPIASPTSVVWRGIPGRRRVALTFDDGPDPRWTPMALRLLEKHRAKGTFFMLGDSVARHPEIAKSVAAAGHEIGSHGSDHRHMCIQRPERLERQLRDTHEQISRATGSTPRLMRPPYGQFDAATTWAIAQLDYTIALWSHRMTADRPWDRAKDCIATATDGMIMLCHDGRGTPTVDQMRAADWLVGQMTGQGWEFVTVSDLMVA